MSNLTQQREPSPNDPMRTGDVTPKQANRITMSNSAPIAPPPAEKTETPAQRPAASRPRTKTPPPKVEQLPPWRVILHNDDVNDMGHVVETIIELVRVNPRKALLCTLTAHRMGLCHLVSTHREKAELLQDQFKCKALTVTIEPEA